MTCEHIKEAIRLIDEARTILNWKDDINILGDAVGGAVTLGFWSTGRFASNLREATRAMREANSLLSDAKKSLSICKCLSEARKNNELEIKELWIESAESRIRQLQEENLEEKLIAKKEDLDRLLQELTITGENKKSIKKDLCENYEKLLSKELPVHIKKTLEDNNEMIQDNLLDRTEISFDNWKRISQLCKEIVELRMKLETEVVASIEVPFRQFLQI